MSEIENGELDRNGLGLGEPDRRLLDAVALGPAAVEAAIADGAGAKAAGMLDLDGCTPFLLAAEARDLRSMELLAPLSDIHACDIDGRNALHMCLFDLPKSRIASREEYDRGSEMVIKRFAALCNAKEPHNLGGTALMAAASRGLPRSVEALLPFSDVDARDHKGNTALSWAAMFMMATRGSRVGGLRSDKRKGWIGWVDTARALAPASSKETLAAALEIAAKSADPGCDELADILRGEWARREAAILSEEMPASESGAAKNARASQRGRDPAVSAPRRRPKTL